ncbi:hypothetical protein ALC60_08397 [Trachymyrmex zeteki]|uniref:Uncharacterized protein n=1 Tax=Mycetomoellerius zeteki TaxID=64791 RepID=A0A151WXK1_9HYME|nr:hypothetical protein ALC60_08397 [Trachymyrmex zeteki]
MPDVKICFVKGRVASRSHKHPPVRVLFPALKRVVQQPRLLRREILSTPSSCCCSLVNNDSHWIPGLDLGWLRFVINETLSETLRHLIARMYSRMQAREHEQKPGDEMRRDETRRDIEHVANSRWTWFETRHSPSASSDGIPSILNVPRFVRESSPKSDSHARVRIGRTKAEMFPVKLLDVEFDPGERLKSRHMHTKILRCKMNVLGNGVSSYQILRRLKVNERSQGETFRKEKSPSLLLVSSGTFQKTTTAGCRAAWVATNGILLYAMKKPLNGERTPDRIRNRLIGQKNAGDNESHYLMVIPPLSAIENDTATRVSDNEWTYCR